MRCKYCNSCLNFKMNEDGRYVTKKVGNTHDHYNKAFMSQIEQQVYNMYR